ncbi:MAG: hypothetical protein J6M17_03660 [Ruminococcus sp.]|nr:hypothetical protein [Ruminococcus sp.]
MTAEKEKKIAEKMRERYPVDERVSQTNMKALAGCGVAAIVYDIAMLVYKCLRENGNPIPEMILLAVMAFIITLSKKKAKIVEKPEAMGRLLDTGTNAGTRIKRFGMYLLETAMFMGFIALADLVSVKAGLSDADSRVFDRPVALVIFFVICMLFTVISGERKAKKYNAYQKQLDEDENDLDD